MTDLDTLRRNQAMITAAVWGSKRDAAEARMKLRGAPLDALRAAAAGLKPHLCGLALDDGQLAALHAQVQAETPPARVVDLDRVADEVERFLFGDEEPSAAARRFREEVSKADADALFAALKQGGDAQEYAPAARTATPAE